MNFCPRKLVCETTMNAMKARTSKPLLKFFGVLVLLAHILVAADSSAQTGVRKDVDQIQGTWKIVALEYNGKQAPPEIVATLKLVFKNDTLAFLPGEPGFTNYKFKLDPTTKPAGFAMTHADGVKVGNTQHGIYSLEGDRLRICFASGNKIPTVFVAGAKSAQTMYTLKREK